MTTLEIIGANLRALRKEKNLTQEQLEDRSGVSVSTIRRLEYGDEGVTLGCLVAVLEALETDLRLMMDRGFTIDLWTDSYDPADLIVKDIFFPRAKIKSFHIYTLRHFIMYLPLMKLQALRRALPELCPIDPGQEYGALRRLELLYQGIKDTPARRFADKIAERDCYTEDDGETEYPGYIEYLEALDRFCKEET